MEPLTFGTKLKRAQTARGLSQQELADRSGVGLAVIRALESDDAPPPQLEMLGDLAKALDLPAVYFVARDYREYMQAKYYGLNESQQRALLAQPVFKRIEWAVHELESMFHPQFSLARLSLQVPMLSAADLSLALTGALPLSGEQYQALTNALGLPHEVMTHTTLDMPPQEFQRYLRVIQLAHEMHVTPEALAQFVGNALIS